MPDERPVIAWRRTYALLDLLPQVKGYERLERHTVTPPGRVALMVDGVFNEMRDRRGVPFGRDDTLFLLPVLDKLFCPFGRRRRYPFTVQRFGDGSYDTPEAASS